MSEPKRTCLQCRKEKPTGSFHGTVCEACHKANQREKHQKPVEKSKQFQSFKKRYYQTADNLDFFGYSYQEKAKALRETTDHMPSDIGEAILAESNRRSKLDNEVLGGKIDDEMSPDEGTPSHRTHTDPAERIPGRGALNTPSTHGVAQPNPTPVDDGVTKQTETPTDEEDDYFAEFAGGGK